jgi:hypothetical protein
LRAGDTSAFTVDAFAAGGFLVSSFAAVGFDPAATRADFSGADDFNVFEGALCDALGEAPAVGLLELPADFFAAGLRAFAGGALDGALDDLFDRARVAFPEEVFGDFLRVFLDIRLPFVAFSGSTIGISKVASRGWESSR